MNDVGGHGGNHVDLFDGFDCQRCGSFDDDLLVVLIV